VVETFDLRGAQIGERILGAIRRAGEKGDVALDCTGATFFAAVNLSDLTFAAADLSGATFKHGLRLRAVRFPNGASFDRARASDFFLDDAVFEGNAGFRGLRAADLSVRESRFECYASFDGAELGSAGFRDVDFAAEARFRALKRTGPVTMRSVRFAAAASFHESTVKQLSFPDCVFHGPLQTKKLAVEGESTFPGAQFTGTRALDLSAGAKVSLREASFSRPIGLVVKSPMLDASRACFEEGADIALEPGGCGIFSAAVFGGDSLIATSDSKAGAPAKIESMDRARVGRLTLHGLDLSECSFARLHRLDDVLISGRGQLALAPQVVKGAYRREVLADELALRDGDGASAIADVYRAMRKAREASHDYPGAADFYYGEMEMRRAGADSWGERAVLLAYWLVSGYGMRAERAALSFVLTLMALSIGFQTIGLVEPPCFWQTVAWTLTATVSLTHPAPAVDLTTAGMYMNVAARLLGPALIALTILGLRSRVRR
jgi:uncharacterized protein YjbI with pentapeptide repeats